MRGVPEQNFAVFCGDAGSAQSARRLIERLLLTATKSRSRPVAEVRTAKTRVATLTVDAGPMPIELTPMCGPAAARVMVVKTSFAVSPHREHRHLRAAPLDAHRWKRFESDSHDSLARVAPLTSM